jgi:hypothetical protein
VAFIAAACFSLPTIAAPKEPLSSEAAALYDWVVAARDHRGLPFMIVDKRRARLWVFDRAAELKGDAPVLLGSAVGDHIAPGIGEKKLSEIDAKDRTTPAGRFVAEIGTNLRGEDVVWVDYDSGLSMHRVLTTNAGERRPQRLQTATTEDNRVSAGCINVPTSFFETVVLGTVRPGTSVVYVLPESKPMESVFRLASGPRQTRSQ